jgi:hypothetical protein
MNVPGIIVGLIALAYIFLYISGRYYLIREDFQDLYYNTTLSDFSSKRIKRIQRA